MKRGWLMLLVCLLAAAGWNVPRETAAAPGAYTSAEGSALIDVTSGRILYSAGGDKRMRIASLTKIMTAIVAIEHGDLESKVKVSKNAFGKEGSSIYLKLGEEMVLRDMIYGLMLRSGNDAATAIAEHVGGSVEGFAYLMNEQARMIGMESSSFMNPSGLDEEGHYSTARDMARLTAYALRNPVFREIVKTKVKKVPNPNETWDYTWVNKNKMLSLYDGSDGVKTGYTKLAKRCLVSSATRDGQQLAVVTLNDPNDWIDHARLLDYGFQTYPLLPLAAKGEPADGTELVIGSAFRYPAASGERNQFSRRTVLADPGAAGYRLGELGRMEFLLGDKVVGSVPLFAKESPRLQWQEKSAFSSMETDYTGGTRAGKWLYILEALTRVLFTGQVD